METPLNQAMLQEIYEGDTDLFVELMEMVQNRFFDDMEEIRTLIRRNEHRQLRHKVHQTKSMLVSIGAGPSVPAAENLEAAVREGRDAEYSSLFTSLVFEIGALIAYYKGGNWRSHFQYYMPRMKHLIWIPNTQPSWRRYLIILIHWNRNS